MGGGGHWHGRRPTSVSEDGDGVLDGGDRGREGHAWLGSGQGEVRVPVGEASISRNPSGRLDGPGES
jgi:hypothetical protein